MASQAEAADEVPPSVADHPARQLLGQLLRIVVSDKRTFVGTLECFDAAGNLILSNADEYFAWKGDTSLDRSRARRIGTVLVGPDHIVSAEQLNGP